MASLGSPGAAGPQFTQLNITAATVIFNRAGQCFTVTVVAAGSTPGGVYDNNSNSSGNVAAAQFGALPNTVGSYNFYGFPCGTGLVLVPGTGQILAVSYT